MNGSPDPLLIIGQQVGILAIVVVLIAVLRRLDVAPLHSRQQSLTGLVFGLGAILAMQTRGTLLPETLFDAPSVMMALSGLVCGPLSALVTGATAILYLLWRGGDGLPAVLFSIAAIGGTGAGLFLTLKRRNRSFDYADLPLLAALTTAITYASVVLLPSGSGMAAFQDLWLRLLLRNFIGIGLLGALLIEERRRRELTSALTEAVALARRQAQEIRATDERLREAQKMQTLGQLTGGIAHDFNNLLVVILGNAEMLADQLGNRSQRGLAEQILGAAERAADLTQKLLAFGRKQSLQERQLDLAAVVDEMQSLLRRTLGPQIELDIHTRGPALARADRALLESAIVNLAVNARDAMPFGGRLVIETGTRAAGAEEEDLVPGEPVAFVSVADTGSGISPDILGHVFEPFFTTKEVGKGSGLGLSMVYGFAKQSGGYAGVESQVGRGTTVSIVLRAGAELKAASSANGQELSLAS